MINKGCIALSIQLHTGIDYFMAMPVEELNEIAAEVNQFAEEVASHGKK
ncbi:MAG: hypothetical protein RRY97_09530 [Oscillibacter sp.]